MIKKIYMEYATLLMMIVTFLQEKRSNKERSLQDLKAYLHEKNFSQILDYLENNQQTQIAVEHLLETEFSELKSKIDLLSGSLTSVASKLSGFDNIAPVTDNLTEQAIEVLSETANREKGVLLVEHNSLAIAPWFSGSIPVQEPRFLEEDIKTLQLYGWISRVRDNNYRITRNGLKAYQILKRSD